ncbi:MAG: hypothetical protein LBT15_04340 [Synergistaceae bacterium]|nr:hypothetical protein [Synergistaceae bacterium]
MNLKERLAERLQAGISLTERPYRDIFGEADEAGCDEATVLRLTGEMIGDGLIRSFGAFADFERLGYGGFLCGLAVPEDRIDEVAALLSARREVTHAYLRAHEANLWYTALVKDAEKERFTDLPRLCRCPFVVLTTRSRLKLSPTFRFSDSSEVPPDAGDEISFEEYVPAKEDIALLALLQARFPLVPRPFDEAARKMGTTEGALLERLRALRRTGVLRRVGASLDHRRVGYGANALVAWDAEDALAAGKSAARFPWVSHCYLREVRLNTLPFRWPYGLYTMLHARSREALAGRIQEMESALAPRSFVILPTVRELKKTRYLLP